MCTSGGKSFKRDDWLKVGGGALLAATGLGAAGIGPMAGLFGTMGASAVGGGAGAAAAGQALAGGATAGLGGGTAAMFGPTAAGAELLSTFGSGAAALTPTATEIGAGVIAGTAAPSLGMPALGASATAYEAGPLSGLLGNAGKGLKAFSKGQQLVSMAQGPQPQGGNGGAARPAAPEVSNHGAAGILGLYGVNKKRREYA